MQQASGMKIIARILSEFPEKFGIPRQSGMIEELCARVVFEPEYRVPEAVRGLEQFSHIWLIWQFSESIRDGWSPTVRPPRLGGNTRVGVFASRSPFRPNPIGLSSVRLERIDYHAELGPILQVRGADLMDGTPIFDIKPYLPYADSHPEAAGGFGEKFRGYALKVDFPENLLEKVPEGSRMAAVKVLGKDPRPSYQDDPERVYGLSFAGVDIRFTVAEGRLIVQEVREGKGSAQAPTAESL